MSSRRNRRGGNFRTKNRSGRGPDPYNANRYQPEVDSEVEDSELKPYVWDPRPTTFKGPTKAQLTERQFNPLSVLPLSPDSQWRRWEAGQKKKEKEHNARIYRAREADEEDVDMDDRSEHQYGYQDPRPRHYNPQLAQPRKNIPDKQPDKLEDKYDNSPPKHHAPQPRQRKRPIWDEDLDEEAPKQRKKSEARSESSYANSLPVPSSRSQSPARRVTQWHPPQNRFRHPSPSTGLEPTSSKLRSEQRHSSNPYSNTTGDDTYSHPRQMVPQPSKVGPKVPPSYSPAAPRLRPHTEGTTVPEVRMTPESTSPDLPLFVSQSIRVEKNWPTASVNDESEDGSSLKTPLGSSPTRNSQSTAKGSGNMYRGPASDMANLQCLDFKKGILAPIEMLLGASIKDIDFTSQGGAERKMMTLEKMFSMVEVGTKKTLDAPLDNLALVQKKGFLDLKEDYRRAINKVEKCGEDVKDKDREIARLEDIIGRERRGRG
ncbi:hypothetical protein IFR05_008866 [Cadophora sp. M221]|nr:hypothetical protein IFR05_008866 [Cadophora sp. M221]